MCVCAVRGGGGWVGGGKQTRIIQYLPCMTESMAQVLPTKGRANDKHSLYCHAATRGDLENLQGGWLLTDACAWWLTSYDTRTMHGWGL